MPWNDLDGIIDTATNWITKHDGNSLRGEYTFDIPNAEKQTGPINGAGIALNLYPNPAAAQLQLDIATQAAAIREIKIVNASGSVVRMINHPGTTSLAIDLTGYKIGTYFVKVNTTEGTVTGKFVVQH